MISACYLHCRKLLVIPAILSLLSSQAQAVSDSIPENSVNAGRLCYTISASVLGLAGTTILLNEAWYKDHPRSSFHLYNDWGEWLQTDKTGHIAASYSISLAGIHLMKQTGMPGRRAAWAGGAYGPVFLSVIEILDGFSENWGFSIPDMAANFAGSALAISQEIFLEQQVIRIKYSYHESGLAQYRPDALGRNLPERMLKDYNGQTHWVSANIEGISGKSGRFPEWLNISLGYSAYGMLGGHYNPALANGNELPVIDRHRQFYLSPDIDLSKIRTGSDTVNAILRSLNFIKVPAPAIEYNRGDGVRFHLLFF